MHSEITELTADEVAALATLPREIQPGDMLEERVIRALRKEGHFGAKPQIRPVSRRSIALKIAAGIALFAGGVATGRYLLEPASQQQASTEAKPMIRRGSDSAAPGSAVRPANRSGSRSVASTEMWL